MKITEFVAVCPSCCQTVGRTGVGTRGIEGEREIFFLTLGRWRAMGLNVFPRATVSKAQKHLEGCRWKPGQHLGMRVPGGVGTIDIPEEEDCDG